MGRMFARIGIIAISVLLYGSILAAVLWLLNDYRRYPGMADQLIWVVLGIMLLAGGVAAGAIVFRRTRRSDDTLSALAWGALTTVLGLVLLAVILLVSIESVLSYTFTTVFGLLVPPAMVAFEVAISSLIVLSLRKSIRRCETPSSRSPEDRSGS